MKAGCILFVRTANPKTTQTKENWWIGIGSFTIEIKL